MEVGLFLPATDQGISPVEAGREAEARGFESLFLPEHTHIPVGEGSEHPLGLEAVPEYYRRFLDPMVALAAAAAVTTRLRLGTGICLLAQRDPIVAAKEVATLDLLSEGRLVFGVGYGWSRAEMAHHGVDPRRRRAIVHEKLAAMRSLWADEEASYAGVHVRFGPSWSWPKPVQHPHPPVLLGGSPGRRLFAAVIEHADGWITRVTADGVTELRAAAEDAGRDPSSLHICVLAAPPGSLDELEAGGIDRALLPLPPIGRDDALRALDRYERLLRR